MKIESKDLSNLHKMLEKRFKFTSKEKEELSPRDRVFIRNIQIKDKSSKRDAIKKYKQSILKGPEHYKNLQKDVDSYISDMYPVHDKKPNISSDYKSSGKKKSKKEKKGKKKTSSKKKSVQKKITQTKVMSPKTVKRVKSAMKKYPDASEYEWQHGVNSKASQQYRIRHGESKDYSGRIVKS